ncbi:MAG TPA: 50S ribosomal protein L9 [Rhizobiales bacterium]|nr:50S ribosomal protein L9 [Hyphomicrobiales bacterium]
MEVILLERIEKLGQMGDVVSVKPGFARNYLLPQGKALRSNKANLAYFENRRAQLEAENLERKSEAEQVAEKLNGQSFIAIRQAGDSGQLYGSGNTRDIAAMLTEGGFTANRGQIVLEHPIKVLGLHDVRVILHPEVISMVIVNVARTEEEAERQARGEDVTIDQFDEEDKYDVGEAGAMFEDEDVARHVEEDLSEEASEDEAEAESDSASEGNEA